MSNTLNFVLASPNDAADKIDEMEKRVDALEAALRGWKMAGDTLAGRLTELEAALREIKDQYLTPDQSSAIARAALEPTKP